MRRFVVRVRTIAVIAIALLAIAAPSARAADTMYYPAYQNVTNVLVNRINAETVRVDISAWYLTERAISIALVNRFRAGVPVRLMGDRGAIFEADLRTKHEFYWLAQQGVPIRVRYNPNWYPEIVHWKAIIFAGQNLVSFGSANLTPFELAPASSTDYKDETVLLSDDINIVNAFKTQFDRMWNDTTPEPRSRVPNPPYFRNWNDACAAESACADYATQYPNPTPMIVNTNRLEPDYPLHEDMVWSQGPAFNARLVQEINREPTRIDLVVYRLTVQSIADAIINKFRSGVTGIRVMIEPDQYGNRLWPEYWLTHANVDRMWAAGIPIKQRVHAGLTHMKTLITSSVATNGSSNFAEFWQRDHNYFIPASIKPALHQSMQTRINQMWDDPAAFGTFTPRPADAARLSTPANGSTNVSLQRTLVWARAAFATSYDIYMGTSSQSLSRVANVPAVLTTTPPATYSWTPSTPLQGGTTYYWRVVSRTFATDVNPAIVAASATWSFTTQGGSGGAIPSGWSSQDIGPTGLQGSSSFSNGVFSISGAGANIWGTSDGFRYVYQTLPGDGQIVARVVTQEATHTYAKAGIMIRSALTDNSSHVILDAVPAPGIEFMTRSANGAATTWLGGADGGAPRYLRLTRSGGTVTSAVSSDGTSWTTIGSTSLPSGAAYIGMVVSSLRTDQLSTSTFDNVAVSGGEAPPPPPPPSLPSPWASGDIGSTTLAGSASFSNGSFTVSGSGANVWGTLDGLHYLYQPLPGDGVVTARLTSIQNTNSFAKAGVMIRQQLTGNSAHVLLSARPNNAGIEFLTRSTTGGQTSYLGGATQPTPGYLRLTRSGTTITAAVSSNGTTWSNVGSTTLPTGGAYIGLFVSSVNTSQLNTSTFDNVAVTLGAAPPPPPPPAPDVVIYASDIPADALHGGWFAAADPGSPAGTKLATPDQGYASLNNPLASPVHYVDVTFTAAANVPYTLWLRLQALANVKTNDAVWVQFSDARSGGTPVFPLNSTSGLLVNLATDAGAASLQNWGWANRAYWFAQPTTFTFATSGTHTMRIQLREDGVALDQIVLSAGPYLSTAPGGPTNDTTIVPKP